MESRIQSEPIRNKFDIDTEAIHKVTRERFERLRPKRDVHSNASRSSSKSYTRTRSLNSESKEGAASSSSSARRRKNVVCTNCNERGHDFKHCTEPVTSWGIILVRRDTTMPGAIRFLLVRRAHSLGYAEFIRGHYEVSNMHGIYQLFQHMTPAEIDTLRDCIDFDVLWSDFWGSAKRRTRKNKEFTTARAKFNMIRTDPVFPLSFYINNVAPLYTEPEWGFPKGRRQAHETQSDCAVREFCEETAYKVSDIQLVPNVNPIEEILTGTDSITYKHVYYLAEDLTRTTPMITDINRDEVGAIQFFTPQDAIAAFRDYHVDKRDIIRHVTDMYAYRSRGAVVATQTKRASRW